MDLLLGLQRTPNRRRSLPYNVAGAVTLGLSFIVDKLNAGEIETCGQAFADQLRDGPVSAQGEAHIVLGIK